MLRDLCLMYSRVDCDDLKLLKDIRRLADLDLTGVPLTNDGLKMLADIDLEELKFEGDSLVTDAGFAVLARFPRLRSLAAACPEVTDVGARTLLDMPALQEVRISRANLTDETVTLLPRCPHLKVLVLESCPKVTDKSESVLAGMKWLTKLSLRGTGMTIEAGQRLQTALPLCKVRLTLT